MLYKTKLPSLESASVAVQQRLFELGFTWVDGSTSISHGLENCHLIMSTQTNYLTWIGTGALNEIDFFNYPATFIQWHRLFGMSTVLKENAEDTQIYNNMVYYNREGWKHDL